jgi:hypothetical protein
VAEAAVVVRSLGVDDVLQVHHDVDLALIAHSTYVTICFLFEDEKARGSLLAHAGAAGTVCSGPLPTAAPPIATR